MTETPWFHITWMHKSWVTKFCMIVPSIFSIITAVLPLWHRKYQFTCRKQQAPDNRFTCLARIAGPQYGTCFISPFWCLEFSSGSQIFWKFVEPWPIAHKNQDVRHLVNEILFVTYLTLFNITLCIVLQVFMWFGVCGTSPLLCVCTVVY
jgi:hypothetical protein